MKKASITEAKNGLSGLIDRVRNGASVLIMDRGRAVARLEPVTSARGADAAGRLERLVRNGLLRPAREAAARRLLTEPPPRARRNASAVQALLEDRRTGR